VNRAFLVRRPCLAAPRRRTFLLLLGDHVEEHLQVLTKLLFLRGGWLEAGLEEYGRCSEVLGGPFGDGPTGVP
jgi:hypothetical protein